MNAAFFYYIDEVLYFTIYDMLIDEQIEKIIFCRIVTSYFWGSSHISILLEFEFFCKSLAYILSSKYYVVSIKTV